MNSSLSSSGGDVIDNSCLKKHWEYVLSRLDSLKEGMNIGVTVERNPDLTDLVIRM
jgi:hypothetical protein